MEGNESKICTKCGLEKPFSAFYKMKNGRHGLEARCKDCVRVVKRSYARSNREKMRSRYREKYLQSAERRRAQAKEYRDRNPEKKRAHWIVKAALQKGHLVRPETCSACGEQGVRIEAHHDDYGRPLEVRWLCKGCHSALQAKEVIPTHG